MIVLLTDAADMETVKSAPANRPAAGKPAVLQVKAAVIILPVITFYYIIAAVMGMGKPVQILLPVAGIIAVPQVVVIKLNVMIPIQKSVVVMEMENPVRLEPHAAEIIVAHPRSVAVMEPVLRNVLMMGNVITIYHQQYSAQCGILMILLVMIILLDAQNQIPDV